MCVRGGVEGGRGEGVKESSFLGLHVDQHICLLGLQLCLSQLVPLFFDAFFQTHQLLLMLSMPIGAIVVDGLTDFSFVTCPANENLTFAVVHLMPCSFVYPQINRSKF